MVSSKRDGKNGVGDAYHERITGIRKELRGFINYRRFPVVTVIEAWDALYDLTYSDIPQMRGMIRSGRGDEVDDALKFYEGKIAQMRNRSDRRK